ncbi:MAG TPA: hypothetical protein VFC52_06815 [Solirubrobacterales bacterium]|nr:hypothetical protein [Solirubrobacterales bacterium]
MRSGIGNSPLPERTPPHFAKLLDQLYDEGELVQHARLRCQHRVSVEGDPIHYIAVVAQKAE